MINKIRLFSAAAILLLTSCSDIIDSITGGDIEAGEKVLFTTVVPDLSVGSRSAQSEWQKTVQSYKAVEREYTFNISMFRDGKDQAVATGTYKPVKDTDDSGNSVFDVNGTLDTDNDMYWRDNVSKWGFKAVSVSSDAVEEDQGDQQKWLYQDKLVGYSYMPRWIGGADDGHAADDFNSINYHTSKEWYAGNKANAEQAGEMMGKDEYKKVPLFMQHQRAWITIILKAGEGVSREALAYSTSSTNIKTIIYNYPEGATQAQEITNAWSREELINYDSDKNGPAATGVSTTRYDAIVDPHNFIKDHDTQEKDIIASISVSNQKFTFAATNDFNYNQFVAGGAGTEAAVSAMQAYNLQAGKHLTIVASLSRASRMIMITAWVEDWTETVTQTICDDYGKNGDPFLINNRDDLVEFLTNEDKNKAGNVGLIVPNVFNLTKHDTYDFWPQDYELKATLNLAGTQMYIDRQMFKSVAATGNVVNGDIIVTDAFVGEAAITETNHGTIERVRITPQSGETTPVFATKAGVAVVNHGFIYQCTSALPVKGTEGYVGGIAAQSLYSSSMPVIDACTVSARVDGNAGVTAGGGIVGQAEGRVTNNTFEYGITLSQNSKFQNIIASIGDNTQGLGYISNNSWPLTGNYTINGSSTVLKNNYPGKTYKAVIDNQDELKTLLTETTYNNNNADACYRVANSFSVNKDKDGSNWIWGESKLNNEFFNHGTASICNLWFKLNGNNKTITLTGTDNATMLFANIQGEVYDLNLVLDKPIVAARIMDITNTETDANADAIAALAYSVKGSGTISNITLKATADTYIQSSSPAGIAVWVSDGGTLRNCASNAPVILDIKTAGADARRYAGGIVACAEKGVITQCRYYNEQSNAIRWANDNGKIKQCNYGGIVGGTSEIANSQHNPELEMTDCSSWWPLPTFAETETVRPTMGSVIGTTEYHGVSGTQVYNAMKDGNAGNWWTGMTGAGLWVTGKTEADVIGRKNSVVPTKPVGW